MIVLRQRLATEPRARRAAVHKRELEGLARRAVLGTQRLARRRGLGAAAAARTVGLSRRTLAAWEAQRRRPAPRPPRGRPPRRLDREQARSVRAYLALVGPRTSMATLRATFPKEPPAALARERARFREHAVTGRHCLIKALRWTKPGWVWALDFASPPRPIEGRYATLLLVRDLASGAQLAALPMEAATARAVLQVLLVLFLCYGRPLVIKWDNDPAFREEGLRAHLEALGITLLYSPPALPAYNGACEAGVGSIKTRTHHEAARHDRPGRWTCNDLEAARRQANETARPWGARGPTPWERFGGRRMPSGEERHRFLARRAEHEQAERERQDLSETALLDFWHQTAVDRVAIGHALTDEGVLSFRQRRISLPFNSHSRARIS